MIPFRKALFDTSFDRFITKRVASVVWVLNVIFTFIASILGFVYCLMLSGQAFANDRIWLGLGFVFAAFLGIPLLTFLYLVAVRVGMESSVALVSIAENTQRTPLDPGVPKAKDVGATPQVAKNQANPRTLSETQETQANEPGGAQLKFTAEDINLMMSDFDIAPNDFALDVLGVTDHKLWVKAGKPDLKPWILLGLPDFAMWLKTRKK